MSTPPPQPDPRKALMQVFDLLKARDDTSRFVGLSLLRSILDTNDDLRQDVEIIESCWAAIPKTFLVRLMKVAERPSATARSMQDLAVAVVHTFTSLLPVESVAAGSLIDFTKPLIRLIPCLDPAVQMLAFQVLQSIVATCEGAAKLVECGNADAFAAPAVHTTRYGKEYLKLYSIAWSVSHNENIKATAIKTLYAMEEKDLPAVLEAVAGLALDLSFLDTPDFVEFALQVIQKAITTRPTAQVRTSAITLSSAILQRTVDGNQISVQLFSGKDAILQNEQKPFAYIFIQYVLIDLRSTIPALMTNLASPIYTTDSLRLAACYDIVGAFVMFLISVMESYDDDDDNDNNNNSNHASSPRLVPDLLLKLRKDLSETFSLTLEFLRDRWDAVVTGASGLAPAARTDPKAPAMLTWENPKIAPEEDPIILSSLRALSLWIREDENERLSRQALHLADMLVALYNSSMKPDAKTDFRHPILVLLQGVMQEDDEGIVQLLLEHEGWSSLANDLDQCSQPLRSPDGEPVISPLIHDLTRVMMTIAESEAVPQSRESFMQAVQWSSEINMKHLHNVATLEITAELWQLATAILSKAPKRLQVKARSWASLIKKKVQKALKQIEDKEGFDEGLSESLQEIYDAIEDLAY